MIQFFNNLVLSNSPILSHLCIILFCSDFMAASAISSQSPSNFSLISFYDQKIKDLLRHKPRLKKSPLPDPINSHLYIICEENKLSKKVKTEASQTLNLSNLRKKKNSTQVHRRSYSQQIQLPLVSQRFSGLKTRQQSNGKQPNKKDNKQKTDRGSLQGFEYFPKNPTKYMTIDSNYHSDRHKVQKLQFIKIKKPKPLPLPQSKLNTLQGIKSIKKLQSSSEWKQIQVLKLQTYFIKMKKSKNLRLFSSKVELETKEPRVTFNALPQQNMIGEFIRAYRPTNPVIDIDEFVKNPRFGVIFDEELYVYFGEINDGKKVGMGIQIANNYKFQGYFHDNYRIQGCQITKNGVFQGNFYKDKRNGQGKYTWLNGQTYEGEWKNGVKHGSGVWKSGVGDTYIGQWVDGKVQGYGTHITSTGQRYEGQFHQFLKHGNGKQVFPNGDKYEGRYLKGNPHGHGKYTWKNNTIFQGQFKNGLRSGKGTITCQNRLRFEGSFQNDLPNGEGVLKLSNGNEYKGQFKDGQKNGLGTFVNKKQHQILTGNWSSNKFLYTIQQELNY